MGCKPSKTLKISSSISGDFEKTHVLPADKFFEKALPLLQKSEVIRKRLYETVKQCYQNAGTSHLPANKYIETIKVFLWSLSAGAHGQILRAGVKIVNGPPYISCSSNGLCEETLQLYKSLRDYFAVITDGSGALKNILANLTQMKNTLLKGRNRIDAKELTKTNEEYARNMIKFNEGLEKVKDLAKTIQSAQTLVERSIRTVKSIAEEADKVGLQAYTQGLIKPREIFDEFGVRPKKVKKEFDIEITNDEAEEIRQITERMERDSIARKAKSLSKKATVKDIEEDGESEDEYGSPRKSGRKLSEHNSFSHKSNKGRKVDSSEDSPDYASSRYAMSEQKHTFGQGLTSYRGRDVSGLLKTTNKIQVDAPEMKDFASKRQETQPGEYFPTYKFYTPEKKEVNKVFKATFESF